LVAAERRRRADRAAAGDDRIQERRDRRHREDRWTGNNRWYGFRRSAADRPASRSRHRVRARRGYILVLSYEDRPGMVGRIGSILGCENVNAIVVLVLPREPEFLCDAVGGPDRLRA
jgi:hypothetical protein